MQFCLREMQQNFVNEKIVLDGNHYEEIIKSVHFRSSAPTLGSSDYKYF